MSRDAIRGLFCTTEASVARPGYNVARLGYNIDGKFQKRKG